MESSTKRRIVFEDVFGDKGEAFKNSHLVNIILKFKPIVIVDTINTATGISYQDVYTSSLETTNILREKTDNYLANTEGEDRLTKADVKKIDGLLVSQAIPQLIRHIQYLQ